ncbi:MAG: zinc ABC transporter substrate-binding protein [Kiloniellales bacterium]
MWPSRIACSALLVVAALGPCGIAAADPPRVVASIAPIHSLVAGVMEGVASPSLIVRGYGSPHDYRLRPSEAAALADADLVFRVGRSLDGCLERALSTLARDARVVEVLALDGLTLLGARAGGLWPDEPEEPAPEPHQDHVDPHVWLDAGNAGRIVTEAMRRLAEADPANAPIYASNAAAVMRRIDATDRALGRRLADLHDIPYFVAHDSFQYFERRYRLRALGSISATPERLPGARRLREIRSAITAQGVRCVFHEPQFEPALIDSILEGTEVNRGVLDPLGARFTPGPNAYFQMLTANAAALVSCLTGGGFTRC